MERAEFAQLRIMLVGEKTHGLGLLRAVLGVAGVTRIMQVEESLRALDLLRADHYTAVFCEQAAPVEGMPFAQAVRRMPAILNPMIPVFVLKDKARRSDVEQARDIGATDVLTVPISPRTVIDKLRTAVQAPRPFILAPDFFGPDRRAKGRLPFIGKDRRVRVPRKARVAFKGP